MAEFKKLINPPIKASEINSESATQGQVLTANGTGGATWQNASGGSGGGTQLYGHNISATDGFGTYRLTYISNSSVPLAKPVSDFDIPTVIVGRQGGLPTNVVADSDFFVLEITTSSIVARSKGTANITTFTFSNFSSITDNVKPL